ncbi:hypothetical protein B0H15DRAFT_1020761 [Mycena belliarum]|uniref:Uncharacterized protein n=1 Tax=Mycena belliarum TaxID=1033014 RepID=A0AAD6XPD9_9AGAR|nr:hypothetical protein B0H15DRAFT_1020761 [Mycena belliae]
MQTPTHSLFDSDGDVVEPERECNYMPDLGADSACGSVRPTGTPPRRPSFKALHARLGSISQDSLSGSSLSLECALPSVFASPSGSVASATCSASDSEEAEAEAEDATDYSFPALAHARALQRRRHAAHPLSAVLGVRGALLPVVRVLGCVVVVAVLAGSGRWTWV